MEKFVLNNESLAILLQSSVQFSVRFSHANLYISNFAGSSYLKNSDKSYLISFIVHGSGCKNLVWRFTMIPTLKRSAEPRNSNKSASVRERERFNEGAAPFSPSSAGSHVKNWTDWF